MAWWYMLFIWYVAWQANALAENFDLIIYCATPAGIAAATAASSYNRTASILLLEPTRYIGGMAGSGGIGMRDFTSSAIINGTVREWAMLNAAHYAVAYPVWQPDNWVGVASFWTLLRQFKNIRVQLGVDVLEGADGVRLSGQQIKAIVCDNGDIYSASYFIDASYEGDLLAAAGVKTTFGREAESVYNETLAGITDTSLSQFGNAIDPIGPDGQLLRYVQNGTDPRNVLGESDYNVMSYSYRACLTTNPNNSIPVYPPEDYNPADFELVRRALRTEQYAHRPPWGNLIYRNYPPHDKYDVCCGDGPVGIEAVGLALGYPNATRKQRVEFVKKHIYYVQGILWFFYQDPSVPKPLHKLLFEHKNKTLGLCQDEWWETKHWPPQLYVREARRMVGDKVFTQKDRVPYDMSGGCRNDSVGLAAWGIDIHDMQRVAVPSNTTKSGWKGFNEGLVRPGTSGNFVYELPYWMLLPSKNDIVNILAPNVPSVSHVAFAGLREEPALWQLGSAAGVAAAIANREGLAVQEVPVAAVQMNLIRQGQFIHWDGSIPITYCPN